MTRHRKWAVGEINLNNAKNKFRERASCAAEMMGVLQCFKSTGFASNACRQESEKLTLCVKNAAAKGKQRASTLQHHVIRLSKPK